MNEKTVVVSMPPDLYAELGSVPAFYGKLRQKLQLDLAIGMFVSKEVSLSRAAEYAGMTLPDFSELLNGFGVPVVDYSADMLADDPYIRAASFFRGNQPWDLIFGLFRSKSVIPILIEQKQIAGCDHFLVVAALLEGKFLYAQETTYLRRMMHPNDTDKDYMVRIVGDNRSKNMSRDYTAVGKQILDWVWEHRYNEKIHPEQEKTFKELLFQMALKFDTPTAYPFWNCMFFLRRLWRKFYKFIKYKFVPGYAERKNL